MRPKERFIAALKREKVDRLPVGNATSIVTLELMECTGCYFPEAHLDAKKMAGLAKVGHDILGYDTIAPVFSVVHEAEALGCTVNWGRRDLMPDVKGKLCKKSEDIKIPSNFLKKRSTQVVLEALRILKKEYDGKVALVGKVFGP